MFASLFLTTTIRYYSFTTQYMAVYGPTQHAVHPMKSKDGTKVIKDREGFLSRWAEHLKELLNCQPN